MKTSVKLTFKIEKTPEGRIVAKDGDGKVVFEAGSEDEVKQKLIEMAEQPIKEGLSAFHLGPVNITVKKETHVMVSGKEVASPATGAPPPPYDGAAGRQQSALRLGVAAGGVILLALVWWFFLRS